MGGDVRKKSHAWFSIGRVWYGVGIEDWGGGMMERWVEKGEGGLDF